MTNSNQMASSNPGGSGADPRTFRIALIAVRSGTGSPVSGSNSIPQAIVVGEVTYPGTPTVTEWRYRVFPLAELEALLARRQRGLDVPHPLDDLDKLDPLLTVNCYDQFGPGALLVMTKEERDDFYAPNDLSAALRESLSKMVKVPGTTTEPAVSLTNFAVPFRDIVRIAFYDADSQPDQPDQPDDTGPAAQQMQRDQPASDGPLLMLDTCRYVDSSVNAPPGDPVTDPIPQAPFGSRLIVVTDPMQVATDGQMAGDPTTARGKIRAFAVLAQVRLPLNGHAKRNAETRGMFRFYAVRSDTTASMFAAPTDAGSADDGYADSYGPWFESMRVGFTTTTWDASSPKSSRQWSKTIRGWLGRLSRPNARARDYLPAGSLDAWLRQHDTSVASPVFSPLLDRLGYVMQLDHMSRELGFRFVRRRRVGSRTVSLALRFEAAYSIGRGFALDFLPDNAAWPNNVWLLFAQEQPVDAINWRLSPASGIRWILTARPKDDGQKSITAAVLKIIRDRVEALYAGLRQARDATPISMLPILADANKGATFLWHFVGNLIDRAPYDRHIAGTTIDAKFRVLEPRFIADMWRSHLAPPPDGKTSSTREALLSFAAKAAFPRLTLTSAVTLGYDALLSAPRFADAVQKKPSGCTDWPCFQPAISEREPDQAVSGIIVGVQLSASDKAMRWTRIGALEIGFAPFGVASANDPTTNIDQLGVLRYLYLSSGEVSSGIDALLKLQVSRVRPAGQDDLPDDARITTDERVRDALPDLGADPDAPLLFPLDAPLAPERVNWTLHAAETVTRHRNQTLQLSLKTISKHDADSPAPPDTASDAALLVIDPAPFRVALVRSPDLSAAQTSEAYEVAVWNAAGENGLSWRVVNDADTISLLLPPQVIGEAMEKNRNDASGGGPPDIAEGVPAAARIGSATRLDVDPSYFDVRYAEPGWNLRRLMGYAGQRAPGVGLRDMRLELMYGIVTRIRPSAPGLRLAEIGAAIGAPADGLANDSPNVKTYARDFNALLRAERRRLAVDRLWKDNALDDLTIEKDVSFRLRTKASSGPLTPFRWPIPGGVPPDLDAGLASTFSALTDDNESFPGGVPWAFESANILRSVYAKTDAGGGRVQGVHLSALGGWAHQRGLWDLNRSAIETETAMGRVHRYALERIGRIGALWNRAKHVIVFERSVVPAAQFYNTGPIGRQQDQLRGRPVLRKVEEYVELLEPVRRYPEKGNAIEAAGCLTGVEFISRKIRVDSRWGGDVRAEGWEVPLWNKAFDHLPDRPDDPDDPTFIYPKPQIRLIVMGENKAEKALEIAEPEKLFFYSSVTPGETGDDTDTWHAVREVDFVDLPIPCSANSTCTSGDLNDTDLPAERACVAGYDRLTIGLTPSNELVSVTHGRQDKGPVALLSNVTIGRAAPVPASGSGDSQARAGRQLGSGLAQVTVDARVQFDRVVGSMRTAFNALTALPPNPDPATVAAWRSDATNHVNAELDRIFGAGGVPKALDDATHILDGVAALDAAAPCAAIEKRLTTQFDMQRDRALKTVDDAVSQFYKQLVDPLQAVVVALDRAAEQKPDEIGKAVQDALRRAVGGPKTAIDRAHAAALSVLAQVQADLNGIDSARNRLADDIGDAMRNAVATIRQHVVALPDAAAAPLSDLQHAFQQRADEANETIAALDAMASRSGFPPDAVRLVVVIDGALSRLVALNGAVKAATGAISADLSQRVGAFRAEFDQMAGQMIARLDLATSQSQSLLDSVTKPFSDFRSDAASYIQALYDALNGKLTDLANYANTIQLAAGDALVSAIRGAHKTAGDARTMAHTEWAKLAAAIGGAEDRFKAAIHEPIKAVIERLTVSCETIEGFVSKSVSDGKQAIKDIADIVNYQKRLKETIGNAIGAVVDGGAEQLANLQRAVDEQVTAISQTVNDRISRFAGSVQDAVRDAIGCDPQEAAGEITRIYSQGSDTLRLFRALGDPPKTDQLSFNRPEVAYVFQEANKIVDMTPAIALVNRVADTAAALGAAAGATDQALKSLGIRLPASGIGDQLVPDALKDLDVSKLFPDFSGIKLDGLFKNLPFPDLSDSEAVKVRHGFDRAELTAWIEADIDVPFSDPAPLLDFGPVQIMIDDARFTASARLAEGRQGTQKSMHGKLAGDWRLVCAGQTLVTFRQTGLFFDESGKIDFNIQPNRVELAETLEFLTNLVETSGQEGDFEIVPYMSGGVPSGVAARLDMVLPPLQTGVFGISDLSLHVLFGVAALPEFEILTELGIGAKLAPFTFNIWVLNGGGFLTSRLSFLPMARPSPVLAFTFEAGIVAGVGMGFTFGVVSGGVWVQVGCSVALTWTTGPGGSTTAVSVFLLVRGCVDVLGLITVGISLLLQVTYDGDRMIASGMLTMKVKISMFYSVSANEHVEYTFLGQKKEQAQDTSYSNSYA
ncbi:hypothetical protein [Paraburkholderia sp. SIMBA_053]|uniref:CHASE3 domain-containing protein n=1 Tax=Paraburkholderia sp. SIMBA_053 TaxID=3085794 RepID=UPI0039799D63